MALFKRRLRSPKAWNEITAVVIEMQEALESWAAKVAVAITRKQDKLTPGEGVVLDGDVLSVPFESRCPYPIRFPCTVGESVVFTVDMYGKSYQWEYKSATGSTWAATTLTGNKTRQLTVAATAGRNKYQYRCAVTREDGSIVYSEPAMLYHVPAV